jgi:hypothetical protein
MVLLAMRRLGSHLLLAQLEQLEPPVQQAQQVLKVQQARKEFKVQQAQPEQQVQQAQPVPTQ